MKTEFIKEIIRELFNDFYVSEEEETTWETYLTQRLGELELNAAKWGAEQAAKIVSDQYWKSDINPQSPSFLQYLEDKIKDAANTLTIDQLPK